MQYYSLAATAAVRAADQLGFDFTKNPISCRRRRLRLRRRRRVDYRCGDANGVRSSKRFG